MAMCLDIDKVPQGIFKQMHAVNQCEVNFLAVKIPS